MLSLKSYQNIGIDRNGIFCYLLPMYLAKIKGANLKRLREGRGLKQWQVAEHLRMKESHISEMEHGKRNITDKTIQKLCEWWGISPYEFFIEENTPFIKDKKEREHLLKFRQAENLGVGDEAREILDYVIQRKLRGATGGKSGAIQEGSEGKKKTKRRKTA